MTNILFVLVLLTANAPFWNLGQYRSSQLTPQGWNGDTILRSVVKVHKHDWMEARVICITPRSDRCSFHPWADRWDDYNTALAFRLMSETNDKLDDGRFIVRQVWGVESDRDEPKMHIWAPLLYFPPDATMIVEVSTPR